MRKLPLGKLELTIRCADPEFIIGEIIRNNIELKNISIDNMQFTAFISQRHLALLTAITDKQGCQIANIRHRGFYWKIAATLSRPILVISVVLIIFGAYFLSGRVFWVKVAGNNQVPAQLILEQAEKCGVVFGANRRYIRSESVKNGLLESIPELQWVGVNSTGCVAVIHVRERAQVEPQNIDKDSVSSIVAATDGVIVSLTTLQGTAVCTPGQAVKAGQVLVSGYTDLGLVTKATQAEAEIYAQTRRSIHAVLPQPINQRDTIKEEIKLYSLVIGKKVINFYKDSGILDTGCVKMYEVNYLTLPGQFELPVAWITEHLTQYDLAPLQVSEAYPQAALEQLATDYLKDQMVSGKIYSGDISTYIEDDCVHLAGDYLCIEMIGQVQYEESMLDYGENH